MSSRQTASQKESADRAQVIAHAWYQAIAGTAFVPYSAREICDRLVDLVGDSLTLLHADSFSPQEAQAIGAALVDLRYIQGQSVGASVELLARELAAGLPAGELQTLQPRLSALLGGISHGFFQQASTVILAEQEAVRQANVEALRALHAEHQRQQENLLEAHGQLKTQMKGRVRIEEALRISEEQFRILFDESPVALWAIDGSRLYPHLVRLRETGIEDFRSYFSENPGEIVRCIELLVPVDVNQQAIIATGAAAKEDLILHPQMFLSELAISFLIDIMVDIVNNKTTGTGTAIGMTPEGRNFASIYHWSVPIGFKTTFARIILSFIDISAQKEAERELQRTAERLEALHQIESGILQAESPQAIAEVALQHMEILIPSMASTVSLFQSSYAEVVMLAGRNTTMRPGSTVPAAADQVKARKRGEALLISDICALPRKTVGMQTVLQIGGRSLLSVPLLVQGELIGTMTIIDASPNAFSEQDVRITRQVGNSVAIAIHNAHLLEMEKNARREAETLREVAANINASLEQEELLSLVLTQLKRVLHFDSASILLYQKGSLGIVAHQGVLIQTAEAYKQAEHLPANLNRLTLEKQPQIISDTRDDPEWVVYPGGESIRCWLGVPLMVKDELIGLLMLDSPEPNFYTEQDAALVLAFANHAAIAIENANLYHEIQQYAEVLETHVAERTRDLGALYEITAIMSQHLDLKATLDKIVEVILEALEIETVSIQIIDQSHSMLRLAAYKNLFPMMIEYLREQPVTNPIMEGILERRGASLYVDPPSASELADMPVSDISSYGVASPIRAKGNNLGILAIAYHQQEEPSPEDLALLASIADHIGVAIENDSLRQHSEHLAVLEERERLARDLHDSATQSLFTLTLFAAAASEYLKNEQLASVGKQLVELEKTAVQTHKEMRLLLYELRPTVLEKEGLEGALQQRIQMVEIRSGIRGYVSVKLSAKIPVSVEQVLFQVANEALNNTLKHSGADTVTIDIAASSSQVSMEIRDNGQGFAMDDTDSIAGMGMGNMRQRVRKMGGTFHYESQPNSGTNIVVHIPVELEEPAGEI